MNLQQVIDYWIKHALSYFPQELQTPNRVQFMLAIGLIESGYNAVAQIPEPFALGYWQMEAGTFNDCIDNFLKYESEFTEGWQSLQDTHTVLYSALTYDCVFACYMSAIKIYRAPPALPEFGDLTGMAQYWKQYYNASPNGADVPTALNRMLPLLDKSLNYEIE